MNKERNFTFPGYSPAWEKRDRMDRNILLIVDDVELNRMLLRNVFEGEYNILEAENGEQALFLIKQYQDSIAAILLDIIKKNRENSPKKNLKL